MTTDKVPICPQMIRKVSDQFSWVDHRLVRERYIDYLSNARRPCIFFSLLSVMPKD